jgi:hypothetical protein
MANEQDREMSNGQDRDSACDDQAHDVSVLAGIATFLATKDPAKAVLMQQATNELGKFACDHPPPDMDPSGAWQLAKIGIVHDEATAGSGQAETTHSDAASSGLASGTGSSGFATGDAMLGGLQVAPSIDTPAYVGPDWQSTAGGCPGWTPANTTWDLPPATATPDSSDWGASRTPFDALSHSPPIATGSEVGHFHSAAGDAAPPGWSATPPLWDLQHGIPGSHDPIFGSSAGHGAGPDHTHTSPALGHANLLSDGHGANGHAHGPDHAHTAPTLSHAESSGGHGSAGHSADTHGGHGGHGHGADAGAAGVLD